MQQRILRIAQYKDKLKFFQEDAFSIISEYIKHTDALFFIDPPYTIAGRRLYTYSEIDHESLFSIMQQSKRDFLMTYDDTKEIENYATQYGFEFERVLMKTTHHVKKYELLISPDLSWL